MFNTDNSWTPLILRVVLGSVVFAHGAQKLLGWFGGFGFDGTMNYFTGTVGLPWIVGFTVIQLESIGALVLISGTGTRLVALAYSLLGTGILLTVHLQHGFFMNWFGNKAGEGFESFLLWLAISISLVLTGGGRYSVDRAISSKH